MVMMHVDLRPQRLDILSICTGGGGLDLGVELAIPGARSVCLVEREAFAISQLVSAMEQGLMAQAPVWSDANTFDGRAWRGCVDGLIGGIPCQPHSLAGKRLADEDERDLWSTARRIIVQSGAWFVLIENVRGMLSSGGAERVWRDLRRLGFEVEPGLFAAAEVGASHERERIFLLAVADARCAQRRALADGRRFANGHAAGRLESASRIAEPSPALDHATGERERRIPRDMAGAPDAHGPCRSAGRDGHPHIASEGFPGVGLADAWSERLEGQWPDPGTVGRQDARRSAGLCDGTALEHATSIGRGEGRTEPKLRSGRGSLACASSPVDDASIARGGELSVQPRRQDEAGGDLDGSGYLFPPGPSDGENWQAALERAPQLEPAFRRVANGLASRLDIARVDRLRMLGNGVVPLQAAYALRTLATRLASRGSAGATRLVRMTGDQA